MANRAGKKDEIAHVTELLAGTKKHYPTGSTVLTFGGESITVDALTGEMQTLISNRAATVAAQATAKAKLDAENEQSPPLIARMNDYEKFLLLTYAKSADVLGDFGVAPPKAPTPLTAAQKAVAAAKRAATRAARHTGGTVQKKSVKGAVNVAVVVTPAPAPEPAAAPAAPAPAGTAPAGGSTPHA